MEGSLVVFAYVIAVMCWPAGYFQGRRIGHGPDSGGSRETRTFRLSRPVSGLLYSYLLSAAGLWLLYLVITHVDGGS